MMTVREMARLGGLARLKALTPAQRSAIGRQGANAARASGKPLGRPAGSKNKIQISDSLQS